MKFRKQVSKYKDRPIEAFKNEDGAIDLASIMVGIIVIGLIGGVIAATIFAVIPWAQDNAAKHQLDSIVTAEHAHMGLSSVTPPVLPESSRANSYADSVELEKANLLIQGPTYCVIETPDGKGYNAYSQSASGRVFTATEKKTKPELFDGSLPAECASIADSFKNSGSTPPGSGSNPAPVEYVDPTPKLTKLTYKCDNTTTGNLPMWFVNGTETWSDGVTRTYGTTTVSPTSRTFDAGVTYTVTFDGTYTAFNSNGISSCLRSVDHWGKNVGVTNTSSAFQSASNLVFVPEHIPSTITNMSSMFYGLATFNHPNVGKWDVASANDMSYMFAETKAFNQDLNAWNVSNVTTMRSMFDRSAFNGQIGSWNTSNVTNMAHMFASSVFNQNIDSWNISKVTTTQGMFSSSSSFNQPLNSWTPLSLQNAEYMFGNTTVFNQPLNNWNVATVTNMNGMFSGAGAFNQPLNSWNTGNVTDMSNMFYRTKVFNQNLSTWNVSNVTNMYAMFGDTKAFNGQINNWVPSKVTTMQYMFWNAEAFNQPLNNWNVSSVTNMNGMFQGAIVFNQNINSWNVANVTSMRGMFFSAIAFNEPLNSWNVSKVTDMESMFYNAQVFNQPINSWDVSSVVYMHTMFAETQQFNQPLNSWTTGNVNNMSSMFSGARAFNQNIASWNVSKVQYMDYMFYRFNTPNPFSQNLSGWNTVSLVSGKTFADSSFRADYLPPRTTL